MNERGVRMSKANAPSRRVLVADDDPVVRHLVTSIVKREGYEAVVVDDGREACRILSRDADFSAAIFDMKMPHLEGVDVIRHMRTERRLMRIPVMLITSERDFKLVSESFAAGATLFLPKPFTTGQLRLMLLMLLGSGGKADGRAAAKQGRHTAEV